MATEITLKINYDQPDAEKAYEEFISDFRNGKTMCFYVTAEDGKKVVFGIEDAKFAQNFRLRQPKEAAEFSILN